MHWFSVELPLHSWDKSNFVMCIIWYWIWYAIFVEDFYIYIHKEYICIVSHDAFAFSIRAMLASYYVLESVSIFWKIFWKIWIIYFLNDRIHQWSHLVLRFVFYVGRLLIQSLFVIGPWHSGFISWVHFLKLRIYFLEQF